MEQQSTRISPPHLTPYPIQPTSGVLSFSGLDVTVVEKDKSIINITQEETYSRTSKQVTRRNAWLSDVPETGGEDTHTWHLGSITGFLRISKASPVTQLTHLKWDKSLIPLTTWLTLFYKNFKNQAAVGWAFSKTWHVFHKSKSKKRNTALFFPKPTTLVQLRLENLTSHGQWQGQNRLFAK